MMRGWRRWLARLLVGRPKCVLVQDCVLVNTDEEFLFTFDPQSQTFEMSGFAIMPEAFYDELITALGDRVSVRPRLCARATWRIEL